MKYDDLSAMSRDDLKLKIIALENELFKLKFQHGIRQLENTAKIAIIKKNIARAHTAYNFKH